MIHFVVVSGDGDILRFGCCAADELALQGDNVLAFDADPGVTDLSHTYDPGLRAFVPKEPS